MSLGLAGGKGGVSKPPTAALETSGHQGVRHAGRRGETQAGPKKGSKKEAWHRQRAQKTGSCWRWESSRAPASCRSRDARCLEGEVERTQGKAFRRTKGRLQRNPSWSTTARTQRVPNGGFNASDKDEEREEEEIGGRRRPVTSLALQDVKREEPEKGVKSGGLKKTRRRKVKRPRDPGLQLLLRPRSGGRPGREEGSKKEKKRRGSGTKG